MGGGVCAHAVGACPEEGVRRFRAWSHMQLWAALTWVLNSDPLQRWHCTPDHWAISPAPLMTLAHHPCNRTGLSITLFRGWLWNLPLYRSGVSLNRNLLIHERFMSGERSLVASVKLTSLSLTRIWPSCFSLPSPGLQGAPLPNKATSH